MFLVTSNSEKRLLYTTYVGEVRPEDLTQAADGLKAMLDELGPDFRLLVDMSHLHVMGLDCLPALGRLMDIIGESGVKMVVRVIPDPSKDIGMNIMAIFHYPNRPSMMNCKTMIEALRALDF